MPWHHLVNASDCRLYSTRSDVAKTSPVLVRSSGSIGLFRRTFFLSLAGVNTHALCCSAVKDYGPVELPNVASEVRRWSAFPRLLSSAR
jgi:hypothetical protein